MKKNQMLCMLLAGWAALFSSPVFAQENLEAVIRKYKDVKSTDINVITQKDPETLELQQIVTTVTIRQNVPAVATEILAAFEKDKPKAYQAIEGRSGGGDLRPFYNFLSEGKHVSYAMGRDKNSVTITKIERPDGKAKPKPDGKKDGTR